MKRVSLLLVPIGIPENVRIHCLYAPDRTVGNIEASKRGCMAVHKSNNPSFTVTGWKIIKTRRWISAAVASALQSRAEFGIKNKNLGGRNPDARQLAHIGPKRGIADHAIIDA